MELSNPHHKLFIRVDGRDVAVCDIASSTREANFICGGNPDLGVIDELPNGIAFIADINDLGEKTDRFVIYSHGVIFGPFTSTLEASKWAGHADFGAGNYAIKRLERPDGLETL